MKDKLIFLDTETTGLDVEDRICQVAYIVGGEEYNEFFKPEIPIKIEAMSVTHITNKMVEDKPRFVGSEMFNHLEELFSNEGILVAHNAKYDSRMLEKEGLSAKKIICTLKVAQSLDKEGIIPVYKLQYLRYYLGFEIEASAHDALGDILVLEKLFERLFDQIKKEGLSDEEVVEKMIDITSKPILIKKFNFGKYKGKTVEEVAGIDTGYLQWLLKEKKNNESDDEDWIYTLEYYLEENNN